MHQREPAPYIGRFAPSPTGPLHFGSLVAAVASYLQARVNDGRWLLRIEDIDPPREQAGASESILHSLERYGFEWDGETIYQSRSAENHQLALDALHVNGHTYPCTCSRRSLAKLPKGPLGTIYPGYCRSGCDAGDAAVRVRTNDEPIEFKDALQGAFRHKLQSESGDFVIRRRDGLIAYQLAVVVDDELEGVSEVVRGIDLIDSTPRQIWLQRLLGYSVPAYMHIPVITHPNGDKLSKLTGAPGIADNAVAENLFKSLVALMQRPPADLRTASIKEIWQWATKNWRSDRLLGNKAVVASP